MTTDVAAKTVRALTIAGSDSGGGAGIQADLKTFLALQVHGMSAITAVTVQNSVGVSGIYPIPPQGVSEQIEAVVGDIGVDAIKIGMLGSAEVIGAVAETLRRLDVGPVVLDPVAVSKHGDPLLQDDAVDALRDEMLALASLVTPNLGEAELFTGVRVTNQEGQIDAAKKLRELGASSALVKGGHLPGEDDAVDVLLGPADQVTTLRNERIETEHTHGTGCTLSAAIAAWLAHGEDLPEAVRRGKNYVTAGISDSYPLGKGIGPVGHFWRIRPTE